MVDELEYAVFDPEHTVLEPMTYSMAGRTIRDYVCSQCWGPLIRKFGVGRDEWFAVCVQCDGETKGYVTKYFADKRREESMADAYDVKKNLNGIIPNPHAGKTAEELKKELGF